MSLLGIHILTDAQVAALKAVGHEVASFPMSEVDKLVIATKAQYPALVTDVQGLITTAGSTSLTSSEKLFSVAGDLMKLLPDALVALPSAKTFAVSLAQSIFSDTVSELEHAAGEALTAILPK